MFLDHVGPLGGREDRTSPMLKAIARIFKAKIASKDLTLKELLLIITIAECYCQNSPWLGATETKRRHSLEKGS